MWSVLKIEKKKLNEVKQSFKKKLGDETLFYIPKILVETKNNIFSSKKEIPILGNYVFCFNIKLRDRKILINLINIPGVKYFLNGFNYCQNEIKDFILKCKKHENKEGFLNQTFFEIVKNKDYKIVSGPFANFVSSLIEETKRKYVVRLNGVKLIVSKKNLIFKTI